MRSIPGADDEHDAVAYAVTFPMGREGRYDDVGGVALFLASELSSYVTGTTIHPDGGSWASKGWGNWPGTGWRNLVPSEVAALYLDQAT